jgi:cell division protein FtsQ
MAAIVREGARQAAKPRVPARARGASPRARGPVRQGPTAPAKLQAVRGVGVRPGAAAGVAGAVLVGVVAAVLLTGDRMHLIEARAGEAASAAAARAGFRISRVHVEGASPDSRADILQASGLKADAPILGLDLGAVRARVEQVGWVNDVRVVRLLPDTVVIRVTERPREAVWQHGGRLSVVDDKGEVIREADPRRFPQLPLVVGAGANEEAAHILPLIRARPRLWQRMDALVRVDGRRWDIRMKDGGLVQLPATDEESALIRLDQLDQTARILELGFTRIDLRDPELVAVRPGDGGLALAAAPAAGA